ncbi:hypothetical protein ABZ038_32395 [Streptomyces sp. NPDC006349]|uniref:hypothetical protein n=1 Tax=unclassified Streptomyces TaxID=2593676 RepID=UPI0033A13858
MQQPPLASLQAQAGNRAVALAIQRAATTRERPGTGAQEQASTSAAVDDMAITPVREPVPEQQTGGKAQGEGAKSPKELAVKAVADRKKEVADASLGRSRAADVVWQQSGKALEAREKAAGARAEQQKHTEDAEAAEQEQRTAEGHQQGHTETANKADRDRKQAEQAARERREAVEAARGKAAEAQEREEELTRQATVAEQKQKKAEADVVKYTQQAEEAEKRQKKAEADVVKYTQEAEKAEEEKKAAEAAEKEKAAAGETALQQAAKAEAEAEELAGAETEVAKWTRIATDALGKAEKADTVVREQKGAVGTAKEFGTASGLDAKKWEETKETAQQEARKARGEAERLLKDATAAAKGYAQAQADVANHGRAAEQARTAAREAGAEAEAHRTTATQARTAASEAGAEAEKQEGEATEAQQQAAIAARQQVEAGKTETAAKTAHTAAKTVQAEAEKAEADAAKAKAEAEAEAKMTPAAKAKRAAKAEKAAKAKKTPEAAEQTEEPGTSEAGKTSRTTMEQIKRPFSSTKIRKWLDPADTVVLRGTAPVGAPLQSHGTETSNTGLVRATAQQAQVEAGFNVVNDALGALNDGRDLWAGHKGSKETGPKSHQDRKKEKSKAVGLTTNGLMTLNDGPKIANTAIKNAGDLGGMAALGDVSGALVMTFSGIFVVRDTYVALTTHKKKNELKEHFKGVAAVRQADLRGVLNSLGEATGNLARACSALSDSPAGPSEETLQSMKNERGRIEGHRQELLSHMASLRDYAVGKQTGKEIKRALNAGGNVARTAAGAVAVASAVGAVGGPVGVAVTGSLTAGALGGIAAYKGGKKFAKRYESVRHPEKWARTTDAQEGTEPETTETTEAPKQSKDGKGGRKRDATKAGLNVLKPLEQGERQLKAQEIYALAAGPAVPVGKNVPDDVRQKMRDFLKTLNCGPEKHNPGKHDPEKHEQSAEEWEKSREEEWANSLNDPERQKEWEDEIAAQLSSA